MATKAFDSIRTGLCPGVNLIEAAAGTGKTYAIAMLVLRFIVEQNVDIKHLLVVTFTKAATEELKERIRRRLVDARQTLSREQAETTDQNLKQWLDSLPQDAETILLRLNAALLDIDQAAIYTIHGFCQRMLAEHALESGQMFDGELSPNITAILQNCTDDFWRKQLYQRPVRQAAILTAVFRDPDSLLASVAGIDLQQKTYPEDWALQAALEILEDRMATAGKSVSLLLQNLESAFAEGLFKDSFVQTVLENRDALKAWLIEDKPVIADFSWLTSQGLQTGLNGRKFMVSKLKPQASEEQKQQYLARHHLDGSAYDALATALKKLEVTFRRALLHCLQQELHKVLLENNMLSFDDLIGRLDQALSGDCASSLIEALRQRFATALIDEFQDTDHRQWRIFSRIFASSGHFLYLIGDPKQAIYKFRGADIYTYFAAQQQATQHYTLACNWRSHPELVAGINRLFQRNASFLLPQLDFQPVSAGRKVADGCIGANPPLVLWQLDKNQGSQEYWTVGKAAGEIRNAVVREILALLENATLTEVEQGRSLKPGDIAILVRSHTQAADYQQALNAAGIPAVLNSKSSVFSTAQAVELYTVLNAIAQPGNFSVLKQALLVNWFNLDGQQLYQLINAETGLDGWISRFQEYHLLWEKQGLLSMLLFLLEQEQVEAHLSRQPQAERTLTNLYHIAERLQQAAIEEHLGINKTLDWLLLAIQQASHDKSEERVLRLESDEDAVKIVTLHSSKGLEYPVVFCPGLWQRSDRLKTAQNLVQCHENGDMIADLGSVDFARRREQAIYEELAEDLRLFYVAVTRAKYRCYLAWADVRTKDKANDSAMAYLFEFADANFAAQQQKLMGLASEQPQAIAYKLLATGVAVTGRYQANSINRSLSYRQRQRSLLTRWQMSSYTALSALSLHETPEFPEDKALEQVYPPVFPDASRQEALLQNLGESVGSAITIPPQQSSDTLPKGPQTGNVVHGLLEIISFKQLAMGIDISVIRNQMLQRYGLNIETPTVIDELLRSIVTSPLTDDPNFCLQNIAEQHCLKELPFYLSMPTVDTAQINRILAASPAYASLSSKQLSGYLTGFIDLVCEYQGKYYVIDYKTNYLPDYRFETLLQAMQEHNYGLQYWLYSLVLDRYLQQRLPEYEYEKHFGGIKYLFVRGMKADSPGQGVFSDLPGKKEIQKLAAVFFANSPA